MAAPCARLQLVRGPVRKSRCGRPFNGIVRQHVESARLKLGIVGVFGLLTPVWWTWSVGQLAYGIYLASGAVRPSRTLLWASIYAPSLVLGLVAGFIVASLSSVTPLRGWITFIGSLVIGASVLAVLFEAGLLESLESLVSTVGNWLFLGGTAVFPVIAYVRRKRAV